MENQNNEVYEDNNEYPEILNQFINYLRLKNKSENTVKNYELWIASFIKYIKVVKFHGKKEISDFNINETNIKDVKNLFFKRIKIEDIEEKYVSYLTQQGNNGNTINRKLSGIQSFFRYLTKKSIINSNIMLNVDRVDQSEKVRKALTQDEATKLLLTIQNSNKKNKQRDYFLYLMYIDTCAREFELTEMKLSQINKNGEIIINGKGDKQRPVYLSISKDLLKDYLEYREQFLEEHNMESEYLFVGQEGGKLSSTTVLNNLKEYAEMAGLNKEEISTHILRYTGTTLRFNNGADIRTLRDFLGHTTVSTTERYITVNNERQRELANTMPKII